MVSRDKQIVNTLEKFKVMRRDDIIDLFMPHVKDPVTQCNRTMKRLRRDGYVSVSQDFSHQYIYFPIPSIKKNSTKIPHFLEILDVYKQMMNHETPKKFDVEPKLGGKGTIEPDVFTIWKKTPIFVEIQRNIYSSKVMTKKMNLYKRYYHSEMWKEFDWQPKQRKLFPIVLLVTDHEYDIEDVPFKLFQAKCIDDFLKRIGV